MARKAPRRFKIQRHVNIIARDYSDKPFLLGRFWRTVKETEKRAAAERFLWRTINQMDSETTAERVLLKQRLDDPSATYRIVEEWPIGSELRHILTVRPK